MGEFSVNLECSLNPELPVNVGKVLGPMLTPMGVPVDMFVSFANVFNSLKLNLEFDSLNSLPEVV